jgi:hypothetical protein
MQPLARMARFAGVRRAAGRCAGRDPGQEPDCARRHLEALATELARGRPERRRDDPGGTTKEMTTS